MPEESSRPRLLLGRPFLMVRVSSMFLLLSAGSASRVAEILILPTFHESPLGNHLDQNGDMWNRLR